MTEPRRPPKPVALQQVSLRITRGAKYNAQLKWKMLKASDLPVKGSFHDQYLTKNPCINSLPVYLQLTCMQVGLTCMYITENLKPTNTNKSV